MECRWQIALLAACGGASATSPVPATAQQPAPTRLHRHDEPVPVDPITALSVPKDGEAVSWITPGPAELAIGSPRLEPVGGFAEVAVRVFDRQGNHVRVAVWTPTVRFSVWTDRANLLAVLVHDQRVPPRGGAPYGGGVQDPIEVILHSGVHVQRLGHRDHATQIRYLGALELEGWIPDDALGDQAPPPDSHGWIPTGRPTLMVTPGTVIRTEPKWSAPELAIMNDYFVETIHAVDAAWVEVGYHDGEVTLHGYASKHDPPGQLHHGEARHAVAPLTPTATAASGTCLYALEGGEPIGYIVGDQPVELTGGNTPRWFMLAINTPWGATSFAATGEMPGELAPCAPAGAVPPSKALSVP